MTGIARRRGIEIAVADTGTGIAKRDLEKLGKPFEQVEGEHVRSKEGTGLGLALVKALAAMHGGEAVLESALGEGTTVLVRLPYAAVGVDGTRLKTAKILPRFRAASLTGRDDPDRLEHVDGIHATPQSRNLRARPHPPRAEVAGASAFVVRKGKEEAGAIVLKLSKLDGNCLVLNQARDGKGDLVWAKPLGDWGGEPRAHLWFEKQIKFDPDLWIVEIEDREGRAFVDEPIV